MGLTNARKQMTRFFTFILAVVMISGGVSFAFAQQAQPRYVVSPFAPFFNFGNRSSGPIPRTVVDFQSSYAPGTIFIDTTERRLYLVISRGQAIRYGIGVAAMASVGQALSASVRSGNGPTGFRHRKC